MAGLLGPLPAECQFLEMHPTKTKIVYLQAMASRKGSYVNQWLRLPEADGLSAVSSW